MQPLINCKLADSKVFVFRSCFGSHSFCAMAPKRDRFAKSSDELQTVLEKYATGPWWLKYPETEKAGIQRSTVTNHAELLTDLRKLQANLAFTKTARDRALSAIVDSELAESWPLTGPERLDWKLKMEKRLKVLCRHVSQGLLKAKHSKSKSSWLLKLFAKTDAEPEVKDEKPDDKNGTDTIEDEEGEEEEGEGDDEVEDEDGEMFPDDSKVDEAKEDDGGKVNKGGKQMQHDTEDLTKKKDGGFQGDKDFKANNPTDKRGHGRGRGRGRGLASGSAAPVHTK